MKEIFIILPIGFFFAFIASLTVYLVTYHEYEHHFLSVKRTKKMAFESAFFTIIFFFVLFLAIIFFLEKMINI